MGIRQSDEKDHFARYSAPAGGFLAVVGLTCLIRVCFVSNNPAIYIGMPGEGGYLIALSGGVLAIGLLLVLYGVRHFSFPGTRLYQLTHFRRHR